MRSGESSPAGGYNTRWARIIICKAIPYVNGNSAARTAGRAPAASTRPRRRRRLFGRAIVESGAGATGLSRPSCGSSCPFVAAGPARYGDSRGEAAAMRSGERTVLAGPLEAEDGTRIPVPLSRRRARRGGIHDRPGRSRRRGRAGCTSRHPIEIAAAVAAMRPRHKSERLKPGRGARPPRRQRSPAAPGARWPRLAGNPPPLGVGKHQRTP